MSSSVVPVDGQLSLPEPDDAVFAKLVAGAEVLAGRRVTEKPHLIGVPFVISAATFRYGRKLPTGEYRDYVSLEAQVFVRRWLEELRAKGRIKDIDALAVYPGESIVINDGSTGIRRQIVAILHDRGAIQVAPPEIVKEYGAGVYDRPYWNWVGEFQEANTNTHVPEYPELRIDLTETRALIIRGGLTVSEYSNEYAEDARTFYLA